MLKTTVHHDVRAKRMLAAGKARLRMATWTCWLACLTLCMSLVGTTRGQLSTVELPHAAAPAHPSLEPTAQITLTAGKPRLLSLKDAPFSVQIADETILDCKAQSSSGREFVMRGLRSGKSTVTFWFGDCHDPGHANATCYLVVVDNDPAAPTAVAHARTSYQQPGGPELPPGTPPEPPQAVTSGPELGGGPTAPAPREIGDVESAPMPSPARPESPAGDAHYRLTQGKIEQGPGAAPRPAPAGSAETLHPPRRADSLRDLLPYGANCGPQQVSPELKSKFDHYVTRIVDPEMPLDLILCRPRILDLVETPFRIQVGDEQILSYVVLGKTPRQLLVKGEHLGCTALNLWFGDPDDPAKQRILSYLINVIPDPVVKETKIRIYKALADEINRTFPDCYVCLSLVGDKLVVSGQVKDAFEATKIIQIIRANAPDSGSADANSPRGGSHQPIRQVGGLAGWETDPYGAIIGVRQIGIDDYILRGESNIVNLLRIPGEQQVALKVTVAEINRTAARSIGVNFIINNGSGVPVVAQLTGDIVNPIGTSLASLESNISDLASSGTIANVGALIDNGRVDLAIQALRNINLARTLAEPTLVALNGQQAHFTAGGQFPVPIVTGATATGLQGIDFVNFGVQLSFVPLVYDKDRIRLQLQASVSTRDPGIGSNFGTGGGGGASGNGFVPGLDTRDISTTVEMREGQTLAIGGLIQTNLGGDTTRIPLLGDLPFLGNLFRTSHTSYGETELVLLVTPELTHPLEPNEIPPLPGSDYFEPNDCEFFLHGKLESSRSYDYRSPVMSDCERMKAYKRCEIRYFLGPRGFCDDEQQGGFSQQQEPAAYKH